jgi:hypothetical protein
MKNPLHIVFCLLASLIPSLAQPLSKGGEEKQNDPTVPSYKEESPLPKGWPMLGPFNQVMKKHYPAYRARFTPDSNANSGFGRLFKHISRNKIPMTAPVDMKLDATVTGDMPIQEMAFLYQSPEVGKTGMMANS